MRVQKEETGVVYKSQCQGTGVAYPSFKRWNVRLEHGEPILSPPGPKKIGLMDLAALDAEIDGLGHGRRRTRGTCALYERHRTEISRRHLHARVVCARRQRNRERKEALTQVLWLKPGLVWAMDAVEYASTPTVYLEMFQDVASRYKFEPVVRDRDICGPDVARHLRKLFDRYGAPLFLKRDNGGNQNHQEIDALLAEYWVLPLNSPVYYPRYNGGIEWTQHDMQKALDERLVAEGPDPVLRAQALAEVTVHNLNHKNRDCHEGRTSCEVFSACHGEMARYNRLRRKEVYEWIRAEALRIAIGLADTGRRSIATALRLAEESWLQMNGGIAVTVRQEVLPGFSKIRAH